MEFNDNKAIYLQIADYICEAILRKEWNPEDRIPSVRDMAISLEVNPNTVMRTFTYLQDKDIIFNKRGIGYFIQENGLNKTLELKKDDFVSQDLPQVFKMLELLDLSIDDLKKYYDEYKKNNNGK